MKAMSTDKVFLRYDTLEPGTVVNIIKLPFMSRVFVGYKYCGPIYNWAIKERFKKL